MSSGTSGKVNQGVSHLNIVMDDIGHLLDWVQNYLGDKILGMSGRKLLNYTRWAGKIHPVLLEVSMNRVERGRDLVSALWRGFPCVLYVCFLQANESISFEDTEASKLSPIFHCSLLPDCGWSAAAQSFGRAFPIMTDSTLELWVRITPFLSKLFISWFDTATGS